MRRTGVLLRFISVVLCMVMFSRAHAADDGIVFGMSAPFSGSIAAYGVQMREGVLAYFSKVNSSGGIAGRKLRLVSLDDGYDAKNAVANAEKLVKEERVFALMAFYGTAPTTAVLPVLDAANIPLIGTISGASVLRSNPHVFHLRASYNDETEAIVKNLLTVGLKRIAVVYQDDGFGQAGLEGVKAALKRRDLEPVGMAAVPRNASNVDVAFQEMEKSSAQAIVMVTLYQPTSVFIKRMSEAGKYPYYVALSPVGTDKLIGELGAKLSRGVQIAQVMPYPWSEKLSVVQEYRKNLKQYAKSENYSYYGLEGYINAKLVVAALERTKNRITRQNFVDSLHGPKFDLGGYEVDFSGSKTVGSKYVEISVVGAEGRILN